ncbi:MAG: MFS transporter [Gammaproteobacteria bacterium]|nr:MFS transporter [Gammaproteobacteria bacterium]
MQNKRAVYSWALYDWANSAYATAVMAGFFPVFFKTYWGSELPVAENTFYLGLGNSVASLIIVILAPILGAIADCGNKKKFLLSLFAFIGILMTALLSLIEAGQWLLALIIYVGATLGFSGSVVSYDALLVDVAEKDDYDRISALGFGLGYAGGGLLFAFCVLMVKQPDWFMLSDSRSAVKAAYLLVSAWWLVFSVPLFLFVKERRLRHQKSVGLDLFRTSFQQLSATLHEIKKLRVVLTFLIGYWLYIDGVDTVVRMAVNYGISLGFDSGNLIVALLITQFVAFPAALIYGYMGSRYGAKNGLYVGIVVYIILVFWASIISSIGEFYTLAIMVGLVQGGVQSLSRSLYARIIPHNRSGEFFGFYNMVGKFAAVIGPVLMGSVALLTGSNRYAMLSISILFILGMWFLMKTDIPSGEEMARILEDE